MRTPKHQILSFVRSETDPKTYNLVNSRFKGFVSVTIAKPYALKMIQMGARYILTGYDRKGNKTFFTGLFPVGNRMYHGDHYTPEKAKKHRLIIIKPTDNGFKLYYFNTYPKTNKSRLLIALK